MTQGSVTQGSQRGQSTLIALSNYRGPLLFAGDPSSSSRSGAYPDNPVMLDHEAFARDPEPRADVDVAGKRASGIVTFEAAFDPAGARMRSRRRQRTG